MAISLDMRLLVHAISDLETCQLGVPRVSVADEMSGLCARRSVRFLEEFQTGGSGCDPMYGWRFEIDSSPAPSLKSAEQKRRDKDMPRLP